MPNKRISDLPERQTLFSDSSPEPFPSFARATTPSTGDQNSFLLIARPKVRNEKISFADFRSSILDHVVYLTGEQLISGQKTFSDPCTFLSRTNINEAIDITETGDISGNIFVGDSGLYQNLGVGSNFFERDSGADDTLDISGDSCFLGDITQTGNRRQLGNLFQIGDISLSGDYFITGNSFYTGNINQIGNALQEGFYYQVGNDVIIGDTSIIGNIYNTGDCIFIGDTFRSGDTNLVGDYKITGNSKIFGDTVQFGDVQLTGNFTQTGDTYIQGDETITGNIYLGEYLYHRDDTDTFMRLTDDNIELSAGSETKIELKENNNDSIIFSTSGVEQMRLTQEGFLSINSPEPIGELSVSGKAFTQDGFIFDDPDKKFYRIFGGDDETVAFKTSLTNNLSDSSQVGQDEYKINFPKTFKTHPVVSVNLEHGSGGIIPPLIITDVTQHDFVVKFGAPLLDEEYFLYTTALSPSILNEVNGIYYEEYPHVTCADNAQNRHGIQRFYTRLQKDSDEHEIFFPFGYQDTPAVTLTLEGPNKIIPYAISSVNNNSYTIIFGTNVNQDYTVHTFSSFEGTKRLAL